MINFLPNIVLFTAHRLWTAAAALAAALLLTMPMQGWCGSEILELEVAGGPVEALLNAAVSGQRAGVVVVLADGLDARASVLAERLAEGLSLHGWDVLRIRAATVMPEAAYGNRETLVEEVAALMDTVRNRVRKKGRPPQLFVVGHGWGGILAGLYLDGRRKGPVAGLVAVNAVPPPGLERLGLEEWIARVSVPVFDLYGGRAYARLVDKAPTRERAALAKTAGAYRQLRIEAADHYFSGQETYAVKQIRGWLDSQSGP